MKAAGEAVDGEVAELTKLKEEYKTATGQDVPGTKPSKKKEPKEEASGEAKPAKGKKGKGKDEKEEKKDGEAGKPEEKATSKVLWQFSFTYW